MANELNIRVPGWTGKTVKALVWNSVGQVLVVSGLTFETYLTANLQSYRVSMSELGMASSKYQGTMPLVPLDLYTIEIFDQAAGPSGSLLETDTFLGGGDIPWTGTAVAMPGDVLRLSGSVLAATNLKDAYSAVEIGTAQAGGASAITLRSGASSADDYYNNQAVWILSGTGAGQTNKILDYVGGTRVATVLTPWVVAPDNTSRYVVIGRIG